MLLSSAGFPTRPAEAFGGCCFSSGSPLFFRPSKKVMPMALVLTSGPAQEPLTLADLKAHLRIDSNAEDVLLGSLLLTSRLHIEAALDIALITQTWMLVLDRWPAGAALDIPMSPLQAVTGVRVKASTAATINVPSTSYLVDIASRPPRLVWNGEARPDPGIKAGGIEIDFTAGFGADGASVPAPLKHAILLLTAHWYEHRDPVEIGSAAARIPDAVSDLIQPFRKIRL